MVRAGSVLTITRFLSPEFGINCYFQHFQNGYLGHFFPLSKRMTPLSFLHSIGNMWLGRWGGGGKTCWGRRPYFHSAVTSSLSEIFSDKVHSFSVEVSMSFLTSSHVALLYFTKTMSFLISASRNFYTLNTWEYFCGWNAKYVQRCRSLNPIQNDKMKQTSKRCPRGILFNTFLKLREAEEPCHDWMKIQKLEEMFNWFLRYNDRLEE